MLGTCYEPVRLSRRDYRRLWYAVKRAAPPRLESDVKDEPDGRLIAIGVPVADFKPGYYTIVPGPRERTLAKMFGMFSIVSVG